MKEIPWSAKKAASPALDVSDEHGLMSFQLRRADNLPFGRDFAILTELSYSGAEWYPGSVARAPYMYSEGAQMIGFTLDPRHERFIRFRTKPRLKVDLLLLTKLPIVGQVQAGVKPESLFTPGERRLYEAVYARLLFFSTPKVQRSLDVTWAEEKALEAVEASRAHGGSITKALIHEKEE